MNKGIGKIYKYDGVTGEIMSEDKAYVFSYNGLEEDIKVGDIVNFKIRDKNSDVVTDIRKYDSNNLKTLLGEYVRQKTITKND